MTSAGPADQAPEAPPQARTAFAARPDGVDLATRYAEILATRGIDHGLIGPRERDRLWDRHLLNCAVLAELVPAGSTVVDVGSGAGLPGIVLACARVDVAVWLVEPLERRVRFLVDVVEALGLGGQVRVAHGRADAPSTRDEVGPTSIVTARAVAPLDRLVRWCLPLLAPEGQLLAMKGRTAGAEINEHRSALARLGAHGVRLRLCGADILEEPVRVVAVRRQPFRDDPEEQSR